MKFSSIEIDKDWIIQLLLFIILGIGFSKSFKTLFNVDVYRTFLLPSMKAFRYPVFGSLV